MAPQCAQKRRRISILFFKEEGKSVTLPSLLWWRHSHQADHLQSGLWLSVDYDRLSNMVWEAACVVAGCKSWQTASCSQRLINNDMQQQQQSPTLLPLNLLFQSLCFSDCIWNTVEQKKKTTNKTNSNQQHKTHKKQQKMIYIVR